jgi:hypothetical protein
LPREQFRQGAPVVLHTPLIELTLGAGIYLEPNKSSLPMTVLAVVEAPNSDFSEI